MSDRKPTNLDPIELAIDGLRTEIRTIIPAEIVSYNPKTQRAVVQIAIKCRTTDGKVFPLPPISEAPVHWPRGGGWRLHWTLKKGDTVVVAVSDRAIDRWLSEGGIVEPQDRRRHDPTDGIILPGIATDKNPQLNVGALTDAVLGREDGSVEIRLSELGGMILAVKTLLKLGGDAAVKAVNRTGDNLIAGVAGPLGGMVGWALLVEGFINGLAPGSFTAANSFATTILVPGGFGKTGPGSSKVSCED